MLPTQPLAWGGGAGLWPGGCGDINHREHLWWGASGTKRKHLSEGQDFLTQGSGGSETNHCPARRPGPGAGHLGVRPGQPPLLGKRCCHGHPACRGEEGAQSSRLRSGHEDPFLLLLPSCRRTEPRAHSREVVRLRLLLLRLLLQSPLYLPQTLSLSVCPLQLRGAPPVSAPGPHPTSVSTCPSSWAPE